jgi:hypothetical protein
MGQVEKSDLVHFIAWINIPSNMFVPHAVNPGAQAVVQWHAANRLKFLTGPERRRSPLRCSIGTIDRSCVSCTAMHPVESSRAGMNCVAIEKTCLKTACSFDLIRCSLSCIRAAHAVSRMRFACLVLFTSGKMR